MKGTTLDWTLHLPPPAFNAIARVAAESFGMDVADITPRDVATWLWLSVSVDVFGEFRGDSGSMKQLGASVTMLTETV